MNLASFLPDSFHTLPIESQLRILDIIEYADSLDPTPEQYRELAMWFDWEAQMMQP